MGKFVLSATERSPEAIDFFAPWIPGLHGKSPREAGHSIGRFWVGVAVLDPFDAGPKPEVDAGGFPLPVHSTN